MSAVKQFEKMKYWSFAMRKKKSHAHSGLKATLLAQGAEVLVRKKQSKEALSGHIKH